MKVEKELNLKPVETGSIKMITANIWFAFAINMIFLDNLALSPRNLSPIGTHSQWLPRSSQSLYLHPDKHVVIRIMADIIHLMSRIGNMFLYLAMWPIMDLESNCSVVKPHACLRRIGGLNEPGAGAR